MIEYQDYGWSDGAENAHSYLYNDLMTLLNNRSRKILDVGCGNGGMAIRLINEGYDVYGTDASVTGIKIAQRSHPDRFYVQDINSGELPFEFRDINFDTIISTEVIEHLYNPRGYIKFCKQVLMNNGGGELIISCPYHGYLKNLALAITGKFDTHFTVLWDGGHIKFWSRKTLTQLLQEFGFEVMDFKGSGRFPYLWKSMFIKARIGKWI
jgi:2-polyprenyl-3-methyl-5-hydroxy-6-metoxy-1,4-benzoquinol methylase